jgi:hypothetical protein
MSGNVIHLTFRSRPMKQPKAATPISFILEGAAGRWSLRPEDAAMSPAELIATADSLREIARSLTEMAQAQAGLPANPCLAEFILYEAGGIDHWVSPDANTAGDRFRLKLGLRNAISSIRE